MVYPSFFFDVSGLEAMIEHVPTTVLSRGGCLSIWQKSIPFGDKELQ